MFNSKATEAFTNREKRQFQEMLVSYALSGVARKGKALIPSCVCVGALRRENVPKEYFNRRQAH